VRDRVEAAGGTALMHRVGHAFMKKRMRDENAVFGGEVSGHFYFRDNWFADNGMIPALLMLELLGREGRKLSEILRPIRERYHVSGEINSRVADVDTALRRIEEQHRHARLTRLDGLSVDYEDWHFNVRPSNTEPLLRLNLEADSRKAMEARRDEVLALIRS
jgi:phosphomannomutase